MTYWLSGERSFPFGLLVFGEKVSQLLLGSSVIYPTMFIITGNENIHESLKEFEFHPGQTPEY